MKYFLLFTLLLTIQITVFAQKPAKRKTQKQYALAKDFFKKENYQEAMNNFKLVLNSGEENKIVQSASFYYGLSTYYNKQFAETKFEFEKFLDKYPNWSKNEEIYYILADIAFQESKITEALEYLKNLKTTEVMTDANNMKGHYLVSQSQTKLKELLIKYPEDKVIGQLLVDKIAIEAETLQEIGYMESLVQKMNLVNPKQRKVQRVIQKKEEYRIAVLLPFAAKKYSHSSTVKNSYLSRLSLSLHQGLRMAQKELDSTSTTKFKLYAYEIGKKAEKLDSILMSKELENMDFLVGPIFPKPYQKIVDFAQKNKINLIVPVSNEPDFLKNDFTYLYEATPAVQAETCVMFAKEEFEGNEAIILYDDLRKNKNIAKFYKESLEKNGIKVLAYQEVTSASKDKVSEILNNHDKKNVGHIFVSSTSQVIASEVVETKKKMKNNTPVLVPETWLKFEGYDSLQYEQQKLYFIAPNYVDTETSECKRFDRLFKKSTNILNTDGFAYRGYDIMHFFGKLIEENGVQTTYRHVLDKKKVEKGRIIDGFNFQNSNINSIVPILKFDRQMLKQINKIE